MHIILACLKFLLNLYKDFVYFFAVVTKMHYVSKTNVIFPCTHLIRSRQTILDAFTENSFYGIYCIEKSCSEISEMYKQRHFKTLLMSILCAGGIINHSLG